MGVRRSGRTGGVEVSEVCRKESSAGERRVIELPAGGIVGCEMEGRPLEAGRREREEMKARRSCQSVRVWRGMVCRSKLRCSMGISSAHAIDVFCQDRVSLPKIVQIIQT